MWNEKDVQPGSAAGVSPASPSSTNRTPASLGAGLKIEGELMGHEDLKIEGRIEGAISLGGYRLNVGSTAHIHAHIVAREVVVAGEVIGNVNAPDRIELKKGGSIVGDLTTARLVIEDGAFFKGAIEIGSRDTQVGANLDTLLAKAGKAEEKSS
jgi:cytoskeletal protein CcmA (bactofilin family)